MNRRTIPGPAGVHFTETGHSANDDDNEPIRSDHDDCEVSLHKISPQRWKTIVSSVFHLGNHTTESWTPSLCTIEDIASGMYDLQIPHLLVYLAEMNPCEHVGSYTLTLRDNTGSISGMLSGKDLQYINQFFAHGNPLGGSESFSDATVRAGCVLYLQKVPIFVTKLPFARWIVVHRDCVRRIIMS